MARHTSVFLSNRMKRFGALLVGTTAIALGTLSSPSWAGDPFRTSNPHAIGDKTEAAFEAIFKEGDYPAAKRYLDEAVQTEGNEPMVHAMLASMAYLDQDWDELLQRAQETQSTAEALIATDPLRGHLYAAAGIFLEGAHVLSTQGVTRGTPTALAMLQQVFNHIDAAEKIDRNDPELSLLKGFMDLMLAVNLPFSSPDQAIQRLADHGAPTYVSQRGIAIGYRDLDQPDKALAAVNNAIAHAPNNPELFYLQAQIYARAGNRDSSLAAFAKALEQADQLPLPVHQRIVFEQCLAEAQVDGPTCWANSQAVK